MMATFNSSCSTNLVFWVVLAVSTAIGCLTERSQGQDSPPALSDPFPEQIRPLLEKYCVECHSGDQAEGEIDFSMVVALNNVRAKPALWQKVRTVLTENQMPPPDAAQLSETEQSQLTTWVRTWLQAEAKSRSGDPGPIILRRLSNAEYDYTIEDLTSISSLAPTREFPVDGAAGEGFTNTGSAQGMSPALVTKYLDAAKEISQHAVLLPDGIRFSAFSSRRDQTDEILAGIQSFYRRFTSDSGGTAVDLQGIQFATNQGGRVPIDRYLLATIAHRSDLLQHRTTIEQVAAQRGLSPKHLEQLWQMLNDDSIDRSSIFLRRIQSAWKTATVDQVPTMVKEIKAMQDTLWTFQPVGQIGRMGGPKAWMEPVSPFVPGQELRLSIGTDHRDDPTLYLAALAVTEDAPGAVVQWNRPRLEFEDGRAPIQINQIAGLTQSVTRAIATDIPRTAEYLDAIVAMRKTQASVAATAANRNLNELRLAAWSDYVGLGPAGREIEGHLLQPLANINDNPDINGWGSPNTPSLLANRSPDTISFSTLVLPPRSVFVHPSPDLDSLVVWKSPIRGRVRINGHVADADANCGNGVHWLLARRNENGEQSISRGQIENGNQADFGSESDLDVEIGDLVYVVIRPGDRNHSCDTTLVDLTVRELAGESQSWNLTADVVDCIQDANPATDAYGNRETWHFCARSTTPDATTSIPPKSSLESWRTALLASTPDPELNRLAIAVTQCLETVEPVSLDPADQRLRDQLLNWNGPLQWLASMEPDTSATDTEFGLAQSRFGAAPDGSSIDPNTLCLAAPHIIEMRLPRALLDGAVLVAEGTLWHGDQQTDRRNADCIQLQVGFRTTDAPQVQWSLPLLTGPEPEAKPLEAGAQSFRDLFPPAVCYSRIVPVDEVVTLTLYYREDHQLQRLMLDDEETVELNRMWDELYFVSQEPLLLVNVFEQISEFATQDRADLVTAFAPMKQPILDRADRFRNRLLQAEPEHLKAVKQFADRAWRRPLSESEQDGIDRLYDQLRDANLAHDQAIRMLLARVLTSPAFLFKLEHPGSGTGPTAISDLELATRLSYFLWSCPPDAELRQLAESGSLTHQTNGPPTEAGAPVISERPEVLLHQMRRLQQDPRIRHLAVQFACQWLHVRDFDRNNDKNESLFPEFASRRNDMYLETVLFFENLFRSDGSILDLIEADHTFVNQAMAEHYGIAGVSGPEWRRVDGMQAIGRGGVLGMATILASQSGASRTSPILRGQWVSETLLGERLPRPPANVPQLPDTVPEGLTARQLIEHHSGQPACARCHLRIDPYGFALEQFDALGRSRPEAADTRTVLSDKTSIEGLSGMIEYLGTKRRNDVVRQFCRKLLGYALGREILLSDEPLLDEMQSRLAANQYRFSVALESIVTSSQFLNIRGDAFPAEPETPQP